MPETIGYTQICGLLNAATAQIRQHHEMLSRLDSAVGDGDHGTTILRTMEAVSKTVAENPAADLKTLFSTTAWAVMSCDGGSTGPLLGSFFLGLGELPADKRDLTFAELVAALEAGIGKLHKQSRAQIGDKTMMDAFLPALAALKAADPANGIRAALAQAAAAAAAGAEATRNMRAKFGRARNLGDRVIGHPDPGAVSISLIFKGFSEGI
jgi:dihydroxyacetone kinase-like protein